MSRLRTPGLGPIVGHTTDHSCRLWIRGQDSADSGADLASDRRTIGVIAVTDRTGGDIPDPKPVYYFRLHREFDRTGTFNLGEDVSIGGHGEPYRLEPGIEYWVRMGTLTLDDPYADDESVSDEHLAERLPPLGQWLVEELLDENFPKKESEAVFRTLPDESEIADRQRFIVGSCRYPGLLWKIKEADKIFAPLMKTALDPDDGPKSNFVLMVGDQIYADMLSRHFPIGLADTFEEFQERYHSAFGSRNMRELLRHVPTYMILDDHEIEDNWTQDRIRKRDKRVLFNIAMNAYMSYQWCHGPRDFGKRLFYTFACAGYPFFVLDTRTQRYIDDLEATVSDNHLLGRPSHDPATEPAQLDKLLDWLIAQPRNVPKFIVSSSVFAPNPVSAYEGDGDNDNVRRKKESDSWPAFPSTRRTLLRCIVENEIQNVVFLSGDIHCSNVAELTFSGPAAAIKAFSITSSAFYWPFWFADGDPSHYVHDSTKEKDSFEVSEDVTMDYTARNFTQEDNYCLVDIDRSEARITVTPYGTNGKVVTASTQLALTPW